MFHPASTSGHKPRSVESSHWRLADIDFDGIESPAIADDALAFRIVYLASLVETGSDLYAANLIEYFAGDAELSRWLRESWQPEEVQHGNALRAYVERVWPEIDWTLPMMAVRRALFCRMKSVNGPSRLSILSPVKLLVRFCTPVATSSSLTMSVLKSGCSVVAINWFCSITR